MTQWWRDQGGIDLDMGGGRMAVRDMETCMDTGVDMDAEELRGEVE